MNCFLGFQRRDLRFERLAARLAPGREDERAVDVVDVHVVARVQVAGEDSLAQLVLNLVLDGTTQRSRTERRVESDLDELLLGGNRDLHGHIPVQQAVGETLDEEVYDLQQLVLAELREDDGYNSRSFYYFSCQFIH